MPQITINGFEVNPKNDGSLSLVHNGRTIEIRATDYEIDVQVWNRDAPWNAAPDEALTFTETIPASAE